jgi:hypothetical protein
MVEPAGSPVEGPAVQVVEADGRFLVRLAGIPGPDGQELTVTIFAQANGKTRQGLGELVNWLRDKRVPVQVETELAGRRRPREEELCSEPQTTEIGGDPN